MHRRYKLCIKQTSSIAKRIYTILIVLLSSSGRGGLGAAIRDGMENGNGKAVREFNKNVCVQLVHLLCCLSISSSWRVDEE
jgi:hypothetical protein